MEWRGVCESEEATHRLGRALGAHARAGDVLALYGALGAGKTRLVRGIAAGLGIDPASVGSPTFVLVHEYEPEEDAAPVLVHVDAYRLNPQEADSIGWEEHGPTEDLAAGAVVVVEWAERLPMPSNALAVTLEHEAEARRRVTCRGMSWADRAEGLQAALHGESRE
jgi:tRNA threonylcarbamoyladenosine biosynthesis protein TsaE